MNGGGAAVAAGGPSSSRDARASVSLAYNANEGEKSNGCILFFFLFRVKRTSAEQQPYKLFGKTHNGYRFVWLDFNEEKNGNQTNI